MCEREAMGRGRGIAGPLDPRTTVGVEVPPIRLGSGSYPAPGTLSCCIQSGGPTHGLPLLRVPTSPIEQ